MKTFDGFDEPACHERPCSPLQLERFPQPPRPRMQGSLSHPLSGQPWGATDPNAYHPDPEERKMRKRRSFFQRASVIPNAAAEGLTLHSKMSSRARRDDLPPRSVSALETRRRNPEPLQHIRDSFFGGRKRSTTSSRPPSRFEVPMDQRKPCISSPFNFEHVTHTAKQQLPPLHTVDERDLPARFWSLSVHSRPKRHIQGIKADDLADKLPAMGIERGAVSSRPSSPLPAEIIRRSVTSSSATQSIHDRPIIRRPVPSRIERKPSVEVVGQAEGKPTIVVRESVEQPVTLPQRKSSLVRLNEQRLRFLNRSQNADDGLKQHLSAVCEELDRTGSPSGASTHDRPDTLSRIDSDFSLLSGRLGAGSVSSFATSDMTPAGIDTTPLTELSDSTLNWEDDVEFCYEHEAESTCQFDWKEPTAVRDSYVPSIVDSDGGERLSTWMAAAPAPATERQHTFPAPVIVERNASNNPVGHRGFSAARSSSLINRKHLAPHSLGFAGKLGASILSPVFSVAESDGSEGMRTGPVSPLSAQHMHFPGFDSVNRVSSDYLSDPESNATSLSGNRSSSSCSSYDPPTKNRTSVNRENSRLSTTSASSIPEHMRARLQPKRASIVRGKTAPFPGIPQASRDRSGSGASYSSAFSIPHPDERHIHPALRRAQSTECVMTTSRGPVQRSQRSRPPTPSRFSRLLEVEEGRQKSADGYWL
jgi:hypothetical protein